MAVASRSRTTASPAACQVAEWLHPLGRLVRLTRLYGPGYPLVLQQRERVIATLHHWIESSAPATIRFTTLGAEIAGEVIPGGLTGRETKVEERAVADLCQRDGLRGVTFTAAATREDATAFVDAVTAAGSATLTHEDVVTLLLSTHHRGIEADIVSIADLLQLGGLSRGGFAEAGITAGSSVSAESAAPALPWIPDWTSGPGAPETAARWPLMAVGLDEARAAFARSWAHERGADWTDDVTAIVREMLRADDGADTPPALSHALGSWLASAIERGAWNEADRALTLLREVDPDGRHGDAQLANALAGLDADMLTQRLDEAPPAEHARFFAVVVRAGQPAIALVAELMSRAGRARLRAAACTALTYLCASEPEALARWLTDARWQVVRNIVFVLGQIGGTRVAPLLADASRHLDVRVRRQVVQSLGQVPVASRIPILVAQLDARDAQLFSSTLGVLVREKNARIAEALLQRISASDFESRPEEQRRALFQALGDVADEACIPHLETLLHRGGWFARRTSERTWAARALAGIGSPAAQAVLAKGMASRAEAVRDACREALEPGAER